MKDQIVLTKSGRDFYDRFYLGGNIEVMKTWLSDINNLHNQGINFWECVVSIVGSSHLNLFEMKGGKLKMEINNEERNIKRDVLKIIKTAEENNGITFEELKLQLTYEEQLINKALIHLMEDGFVYEPSPQKFRFLG